MAGWKAFDNAASLKTAAALALQKPKRSSCLRQACVGDWAFNDSDNAAYALRNAAGLELQRKDVPPQQASVCLVQLCTHGEAIYPRQILLL